MTTDVDQRFITAGEGRRVRHPDRRLLAEAGETVDWNSYWDRLRQDGDVVEGEPPKETGGRRRGQSHTESEA